MNYAVNYSKAHPGLIALFGSGEIAPSGRKVYDHIFQRLQTQVKVSILETPAGFQPNSQIVAAKIKQFLENHLQNYRPEVSQVPMRKIKGAAVATIKTLMDPLLSSNVVFLGPGSPTYTAEQFKDSFAWDVLRLKHYMGASLVLASAATIAVGKHALPVYEIYKSGSELHWVQGLDLLSLYGLNVTLIPHWNNLEGGNELDTSRCYMGEARFNKLKALLEPSTTIVGIDEHTALVIDLSANQCHVFGKGSVTVISKDEKPQVFIAGCFPVEELGALCFSGQPPVRYKSALTWMAKLQTQSSPPITPSKAVLDTCASREQARKTRNWVLADSLRNELHDMGWKVDDTKEGTTLIPNHLQ